MDHEKKHRQDTCNTSVTRHRLELLPDTDHDRREVARMKKILKGNDKVGRLIRLNQQTLQCGHKGYASIVFFGDTHVGHPQFDAQKANEMLAWCLKNHVYVLGMGDLIECGMRDSIGDSVYQQKLNPQEQMEYVVEMLRPLAEANLLLGLHSGNHSLRIAKATGVDVMKVICRELHVPYLGYACWSLLRVGKQLYTLYSTHGKSGSRFHHTKLKAAIDICHYFEADILAHAHVHDISVDTIIRQRVDMRSRVVRERKVHIVLTGSYLSYDKSYAQAAGYPPTKLGSPKIQLYGDRWDIHGSV